MPVAAAAVVRRVVREVAARPALSFKPYVDGGVEVNPVRLGQRGPHGDPVSGRLASWLAS